MNMDTLYMPRKIIYAYIKLIENISLLLLLSNNYSFTFSG